jgi:hypothetical protein
MLHRQQEEDMAVDDVQEIEALAELGIAAGEGVTSHITSMPCWVLSQS